MASSNVFWSEGPPWLPGRIAIRAGNAAATDKMKTSLAVVLAYRNNDIIDRLVEEHRLSPDDGEEIFRETLRWLWLCSEAKKDRKMGIAVPPLIIDEPVLFIDLGWHTFILFTKAYADFCDKNFGTFIHHNPTPVSKKQTLTRALERDEQARHNLLDQRRRQYEYIFDKLGSETLTDWYERLADKYSGLGKSG